MNTNESAPEAGVPEEEKQRLGLLRKQGKLPRYGGLKCKVPGCEKTAKMRYMCKTHYYRWRAHPEKPLTNDPDLRGKHDKHGAKNPKWRGGQVNDGYGRVLIYSPGHPNPSSFGTHVYRYRLVMEKHLGRYLLPAEIVHHKNGDHADDRLENLEMMTQSQHARIHMLDRISKAKGNNKC